MNRKLTFTSAVVVAALSIAAVPAGAQEQRDSGRQRGGGRATASAPAPRQDAARQATPRGSDNRQSSAPQALPRGSDSRQSSAPQALPRGSDSRQSSAPQALPRGSDNRQYQSQQRAYERPSYQAPSYRSGDRRGYAQPRSSFRSDYARPYFSRSYVRPYNFAPYRPHYFSRPYYSFRPRLNIGFGLWLGYPVLYPYTYLGDYTPRVYGYYGDGSYDVSPGVPVYGGVSFDIQPSDADLFVDGEYVGTVGTFTPNGEPLTLTPGDHRIAVQRDGFRPMEWDVTIEPGQVIPYRGAMERY
ncbi:MAG TPA: PEGA domain-containing protein [Vicinamibacterales bacterium]